MPLIDDGRYLHRIGLWSFMSKFQRSLCQQVTLRSISRSVQLLGINFLQIEWRSSLETLCTSLN